MSWRNLRQGWLVCVKSKGPEPLADSTEAVAPALTAAVVTNQIDVAGISLAPRLFAAVRQDMNLRLSQASTPRYDPLDPRTAALIIENGRVHAMQARGRFPHDSDGQHGKGRALHASEVHSGLTRNRFSRSIAARTV
jgi:hypothetical protein